MIISIQTLGYLTEGTHSGSLYSEDKDGFQELNKNGILKMRIFSRNVLQRKYWRI